MIRYVAGDVIGLGLSAKNLEQLQLGRPILVEGLVPGWRILIHYGKTEREIHAELVAGGFDMPPVEFDAEGNPSPLEQLHFSTLQQVSKAMAELAKYLDVEPSTVEERNRVMKLATAVQRFVEENGKQYGPEFLESIRVKWAPLRARMNEWGS